MKDVCPAFVAFIMFAAFGVQAQEQRNAAIETWRCFDTTDFAKTKALVELSRRTLEGEAEGVGEVSVAGLTYSALFRVTGFDRRWDFGEEFNYTFVIAPSGRGRYYDCSSVEDGGCTVPDQAFNCESS